jgi:hypothetical protein
MIRGKRITPDESESREAARSMRVLLWTFALTAIAMCITVVACFASSWTQVMWISAFLLVFTLCKIGLANALFYVMVHYDADRARRVVPAPSMDSVRPVAVALRPGRTRRALRSVARSAKPPRPVLPR